jgi:hypothetical protein
VKTILAFDDFVLNRSENTRRRFKQPQWHPELMYTDPDNPRTIWPQSIVPAPQGGYMMVYLGIPDPNLPLADEHMSVFLAWSPDGMRFEPYKQAAPGAKYPHMIGKLSDTVGTYVMYDKEEPDPEFRYKAPQARFGYRDGKLVEEPAYLLGSPDLIRWKRINDVPVTPSYIDCYPSLLRNPVTGNMQVTTRRRWGERRVCLTESRDLKSWTVPRAVVHPLPDDEPLTHLYSMPEFYYAPGEIFIGLLWKHVMPFDRISDGRVTTEYAYSYDGLMWNRTNAPLFPEADRGEYGAGSSYCISMVDRGDDVVFYMGAWLSEHSGQPKGGTPDGRSNCAVIPGTLKRNRFVSVDSGKGVGELVTQWLRLKKPELKLNATIPYGSLRAELRAGAPIEGYTLDDFIPIAGDVIDAPLKWKGGGLEKFVSEGKWVQLHIVFEQSEVYAITGDFDFTINTRGPAYDRL